MACARHIAVRKLVHDRNLRPARDDGVHVHLFECDAAIVDSLTRHDLQVAYLRLRFHSAVRLLRQSKQPTHVVVEFSDTGHGMSEEQRRRAFTSLLSTTKIKGTGLGLAIVNKVVETHHGKIKVKSRVGRGTTISIVLPVG